MSPERSSEEQKNETNEGLGESKHERQGHIEQKEEESRPIFYVVNDECVLHSVNDKWMLQKKIKYYGDDRPGYEDQKINRDNKDSVLKSIDSAIEKIQSSIKEKELIIELMTNHNGLSKDDVPLLDLYKHKNAIERMKTSIESALKVREEISKVE